MSARVTICLAARSLRSIPKLASASGTSSSHRMTFTIGLMLHADRNAFFYVLDRTNGKFLLGKPFARQTWAKGFDDNGRPVLVPNQEPTPGGNVSYPSMWGATNWMSPSYDADTGHLFITFREFGDRYFNRQSADHPGSTWTSRSGRGHNLPLLVAETSRRDRQPSGRTGFVALAGR